MTRCARFASTIALWSALLTAGAAVGQEWTRFRGPNGTGISDAKTVPVQWSPGDINWKVELPGDGHSSPVLWGDKIFLTSADPQKAERYLLCLSAADGSEKWRNAYPFTVYKKHGNNSFATNTAAADEERVYVLWQERAASFLIAVDHQGQEVWRFDMGPFAGGHGPGISPIVFEDLVIVGNDQEAPSFLVAVDRRSGQERWRIDRPKSDRATYATPCIYQPAGRDPEVIFTEWHNGITGVDARTGKVNWEIAPFGDFMQRAIGSPVIAGDLIIGQSGFTTAQKNVVAVRPEATASGVQVKEVYRLDKSVPHIPTPIVYNGMLFLWSDLGIVTCARVESGEILWQKRVGGNFSGSPVCVNGKLYCADENGEVVVVAASDTFEELARNPLGELCRSTPAVAGGRMYVRTFSHLVSVGGGKL